MCYMGDNEVNHTVVQALDALNIKEWTLYGEPTNEKDFNENFHKIVGEDESGGQVWENDPSKWDVTWSQVVAKQKELDEDWKAQEYSRNRQLEYPDWGTQLNKIYDDGLTKWKSEMVDPIKAKWPKDNSGPV